MLIDRVKFSMRRTVPVIQQAEAAECGLVCIAMVLSYFGRQTSLRDLRTQYSVSLQGSTLEQLSKVCKQVGLGFRALTLEMETVGSLQLPCVLHWEFNHFVVLTKVTRKYLYINDPSGGARRVLISSASLSFTGVAAELWPNDSFETSEKKSKIGIGQLIGRIKGLTAAAAQVLILALTIELLALAAPIFMQWIMDYVITSGDQDILLGLAVGFGMLMLTQQVITALRAWSLIYFNTVVSIQWRANLFAHLLRLPAEFFAKRHVGDVASKFGSIDQIQRVLSTAFLEGMIDGLFGILALFIILYYSASLAAITIVALLLYMVLRVAFFSSLRDATQDAISASARQQSHFIESLRGIRTIKLFQREDVRGATWSSLLVNQVNADVRTQRINLIFRLGSGVLFGMENLIVIAIGASLVIQKEFSAGTLLSYLAYKGIFSARTMSLIEKSVDIRLLRLHCERLADIALTATDEEDSCFDGHFSKESAPRIEFKDVSFRYSETSPLVLQNVSFCIESGESVVLVGPSGGGKSTIASILLGINKATSGDVLVDGTSISKLGTSYIRNFVASVMQDDTLFAGTILDNVTFFDQDPDVEWAIECLEAASISAEVENMAMGYRTLVGDMGTVLSGGQKQRILLARALYKRPRILILDEATSHLDLPNERAVNDAIKNMKITRFLIAHRPETMASAEKLISIVNGTVTNVTSTRLRSVTNAV